CINTPYHFTQSGGVVSLEGCKASREGGGIFSRGNIPMEETATLTIRDSQAERGGGIMTTWINNKARGLKPLMLEASLCNVSLRLLSLIPRVED
ncbi:unnamed protein product, partial [Symbiodinium necroappetens]